MRVQLLSALALFAIIGVIAAFMFIANDAPDEAPVNGHEVKTNARPLESNRQGKPDDLNPARSVGPAIQSNVFSPALDHLETKGIDRLYKLRILRADGTLSKDERVLLDFSSILIGKILRRTDENGLIAFSTSILLNDSVAVLVRLMDARPRQQAKRIIDGKLRATGIHDLGTLRLQEPPLVLSGVVSSQRGRPVAKARVWLTPAYGDEEQQGIPSGGLRGTQCVTDESGRFAIQNHLDWQGDVYVNVCSDIISLQSSHRVSQGTRDYVVTVALRTNLEVSLLLPPEAKSFQGLSLTLAKEEGGVLSRAVFRERKPFVMDGNRCSQRWIGLEAGSYSLMVSHSAFPGRSERWKPIHGSQDNDRSRSPLSSLRSDSFRLRILSSPHQLEPQSLNSEPYGSPPTLVISNIQVDEESPPDHRLRDIRVEGFLKVIRISAADSDLQAEFTCSLFLDGPFGIKRLSTSLDQLSQGVWVPRETTRAVVCVTGYAYEDITPLTVHSTVELKGDYTIGLTIDGMPKGLRPFALELRSPGGQRLKWSILNTRINRRRANGQTRIRGLQDSTYELVAVWVAEQKEAERIQFSRPARMVATKSTNDWETLHWNALTK